MKYFFLGLLSLLLFSCATSSKSTSSKTHPEQKPERYSVSYGPGGQIIRADKKAENIIVEETRLAKAELPSKKEEAVSVSKSTPETTIFNKLPALRPISFVDNKLEKQPADEGRAAEQDSYGNSPGYYFSLVGMIAGIAGVGLLLVASYAYIAIEVLLLAGLALLIAGTVFSIIGLAKNEGGRGFAIAGLIISGGFLTILLFAILISLLYWY